MTNELTTENQLRAENIKLKIIINQLQIQLSEKNFQLERLRLISEQEKFTKENELDNFNWNTLTVIEK